MIESPFPVVTVLCQVCLVVGVNRNITISKKAHPKTVLSSTGIVSWSAISTFHTVQTYCHELCTYYTKNYAHTISAGGRGMRGRA